MLSSLDPFRDDENKNNNQTTHVLNDERSLRKREEETSNNRREKLETLRTSRLHVRKGVAARTFVFVSVYYTYFPTDWLQGTRGSGLEVRGGVQ